MMNKDLLIEEELKEEINSLILEELTVNDEVLKTSKMVEDYIIDNIPQKQPFNFSNGGGKRDLDFSLKLFDNVLKVNFHVTNFNFKDKQYFNDYNKKYSLDLECKSVYNMIGKRAICLCFINYLSIDFKPLPKFYEDVYHEINHLFQQHMEKHTYSDSSKYANISTNIYSENEIEHNSAEIVYLATSYEQDSYISSVYNFVKHKIYSSFDNIGKIDAILKESDAYNKIYRLKELFNVIHNNKTVYSKILLKTYGFERWDRFDKHIKNAIKRFEKKFAMVARKCKSDFLINKTHTWCEGLNNKTFYKIL